MYRAYSLGIEKKDFELIRKILKIITKEIPVIKDLRFYDINSEDTEDSFIFLFGKKASDLAVNIKAKTIIYLPDIQLLHADTGSQEKRQEVFSLLTEFKDTLLIQEKQLPTQKIKDPIPDITISDLKILEENLKEKGVVKWMTTSSTGKTIQISSIPQEAKTDMNITFSELYALKIAMETLDIQEFTVVYSNKPL